MGQRRVGISQRRRDAPEARPAEPALLRRGTASTAGFFTQESFAEAGASAEVVAALAELGVTRPSHIQAAAFRALVGSQAPHVVLGDHAGSGKTLAYLAPIAQALRAEEAAGGGGMAPKAPRALVLAPTAELCAQVLRVARALARGAPFRSIALTGGHPWRTQRKELEGGVDLVVATPGRLGEHLAAGTLTLGRCGTVVLDETDVLLGDSGAFREQVEPLRNAAPPGARFILVTATLPEAVYQALQPLFPGLVPVLGPGLHRTAPGVTQRLVDCSGGDDVNEDTGFLRKADTLVRLLREEPAARTIVFCNKIETCRKVENLLNRAGVVAEGGVLAHHAAISDVVRSRNLQEFLAPPASEERLVLVCTDRASRGIDSAHVEHVVLFDFPRDPSEYVRRAGRTSRGAGNRGTVTILALGRQVPLARQVLHRSEQGLPLHKLPS
ncbi:hypothetical protein WJX81_001173 [Elliptochloris bilobata]|uniref:Uncharacterized protein n=1 Tax=Elliptochloris bilobata TaxID=381761 RepID=A0AAW1QM58_9CHLO